MPPLALHSGRKVPSICTVQNPPLKLQWKPHDDLIRLHSEGMHRRSFSLSVAGYSKELLNQGWELLWKTVNPFHDLHEDGFLKGFVMLRKTDVESKTNQHKISSSTSFLLWNQKHVHVQKLVMLRSNLCICSWSVASGWSLNKAAGFRECTSLHSTCCYASSETVNTRSTAHTGKEVGPNHKEKTNKQTKNQKEDTVSGTFKTTQHSWCENDGWPYTALKMLHKMASHCIYTMQVREAHLCQMGTTDYIIFPFSQVNSLQFK